MADSTASSPGFSRNYEDVPITPEARAAIRPGKNLLSVYCHQINSGQYIDVGITEERTLSPRVDAKSMASHKQ